QETAYALGKTRSRTAVPALVNALNDRRPGVRGAAAVALGQIGDESSVIPLAEVLVRRARRSGLLNRLRRARANENEFVLRAAAVALGQIGSRAAVPALIGILMDVDADSDVRREAARSLGTIGDTAAVTALRSVLTASDPYLSQIAHESLLKIAPVEATRPM
ncbi:MAG TPA: HEAT repeat domain-containing protein, partial [Pyrinomonadaceae bacterium]|nr:HEAT repeat domain-containing protein [Pyrinomonadaceae bacterium]